MVFLNFYFCVRNYHFEENFSCFGKSWNTFAINNYIISEFKDAFELFDRTGEGIIAYDQCANLARCFGYNPSEYTVRGKKALTVFLLADSIQG